MSPVFEGDEIPFSHYTLFFRGYLEYALDPVYEK